MNNEDHIYELDVIAPDFKNTQTPSIIAIKKDNSKILVVQEFTIN